MRHPTPPAEPTESGGSAAAPAPPESELRIGVREAFAAVDNLPASEKLAVDEGLVPIEKAIRDWRDQSVKETWMGSYRLVREKRLSLLQLIYLVRSLYHLCADQISQGKRLPARHARALAETLEEVGREDVADVFRYLETYVIPGTGAMPHPSDAVLRAVVPALARIYRSRKKG